MSDSKTNMRIVSTADGKQDKKAHILSLLHEAKKQIVSEVKFKLKLTDKIELNCAFRKSDALRLPEEDRLLFESKLRKCKELGLDKEPTDEDQWRAEIENQIRIIQEDNERKSPDDKINIADYRKRLESDRPPNRAYQVAKDLARLALLSEVIPKIIRIDDELLDPAAQVEFADILTSNLEISKTVIDQYVKLSELFNKKQELVDDIKN